MKYIERIMEKKLASAAKSFKAVLVTGARQVGKSTLLKTQFPNYRYVTLDDPFLEEQARENGDMFLTLNGPPVTYDEVQRAPELFRYIKMACDDTDEKGLFLLSGSQQFKLMKEASDSLPDGSVSWSLPVFPCVRSSEIPFTNGFFPRWNISRSEAKRQRHRKTFGN